MNTKTHEIYRAYDTTTEWSGRPRTSAAEAWSDADRHNKGCERQGGYGSAIVVMRDDNRLANLDGSPVWPPHGRSCGAAWWR